MQDGLEIKISMLLDGELKPEEALKVLNRIKNEPTLRAKWLRYNAVSCAFKEKPAVLPDAGFFDRVSQAVSEQPIVLSPRTTKKKPRRIPSIAAALAASVAVLAILFWSAIPSSLSTLSNEPRLLTSTQSGSSPRAVSVQSSGSRTFPRRFNDYLITHNGSSYTAGAQTIVPYARTVGYSSDR